MSRLGVETSCNSLNGRSINNSCPCVTAVNAGNRVKCLISKGGVTDIDPNNVIDPCLA